MNILIKLAATCIALSITPALANHTFDHCAKGPAADGMRARVNTITDQMDRIEGSTDRGQQRQLMELHMKQMQEGLRELRKRELSAACRMELMSTLMESLVRHQQVAFANDAR
ncbi:MAG: hypothetical protein H7Y14_13850 [Burkholderiales bacterium]|nr:hypothetical protein [Burkholderiales bacterium]